ncbi:MAG TPA: type IV toxin-antitoxin system AbiEi family antitoxin domain-containing protein [Nitriliruptorales bacterium]
MDRHQRLHRVGVRQHACWTLAQAAEAGFPRQTVADLVARGVWIRRYDGVFRPAGAPVTWHSELAATSLYLGDGTVVARRSAARLWRLPGFEDTTATEFVVTRRHTPRIQGVHVSRTIHLPADDAVNHSGFLATGMTRTLHDLSAVTPEPILLPAAAEGMRVGRTDQWRLLDSVRARPGLPGNGRLRSVIAQLDPRMAKARSIAEIVANIRLRELGYHDFEVNVRRTLSCGRRVELDVVFQGFRVLEINGARYHGTVVQRRADRERRDALERDGYVVRVLWAGQLHDPSLVRAVVEDLLGASVSS